MAVLIISTADEITFERDGGMKRVRPWHERWMSRKTAKRINDMFDSAPMPDYTQMHKEAVEFKNEMLKLREEALARGEKW